jgi:hypothetical protein
MPCQLRRSGLGFALTLFAALALAAAGCSKPAQDVPPAAGAPADTAGQTVSDAAAKSDSAPGQPASNAPAGAAAPALPPPPPPPRTFTLAEGTVLTIKTTSTLSTDTQAAGNSFRATLAEPIVEGDWVVAREGADVEGIVVAATKGGRVKGTAQLEIGITGLTLSDGQRIRLETSMAASAAKSEKKKDIGKVGIAAGAGAIIGGIAGGGKGAAIGAAVGGAGGTAVVMGTRGGPAVIPAGSELHFTVKTPVAITEKK